MFPLIKPLLFNLDPEKAHDLTMASLQLASSKLPLLNMLRSSYKVPDLSVQCMGITFKHPLGLAAGLDKNAVALNAFSALGFSAVELGTVTPKPQSGSAKPRLFRLPEDQAIINRMGFNSAGVDAFLKNLNADHNQSVVGINIGKNAVTPNEEALNDYLVALNKVYAKADYITVNISSPNTKSLRDLQNADYLDGFLLAIKQAQKKLAEVHDRYVPVALKVAPDLASDEVATIAELLISHDFDALIATNTTIARPPSLQSVNKIEQGGLSGRPLNEMSTDCIRLFYQQLQGKVPIIGVGGISNAEDAWQKLLAGADFLQLYSSFIYQGPAVISNIIKGLQSKVTEEGYADLDTAMQDLRAKNLN